MASNAANGYISNIFQSSNFSERLPLRPKKVTTSKSGSIQRGNQPLTMSAVSSSSNDTFSDTSKRLEKKQMMVKKLLHAAICSSNLSVGHKCSSPTTCFALQTLYDHVRRCVARKCPVPQCASYRHAYRHLRECTANDCIICEPARLSSEYVHFQPKCVVVDDGGGHDGSPPSLFTEHSSPSSPPRLCLGTRRRYDIPEILKRNEKHGSPMINGEASTHPGSTKCGPGRLC